MAVALCPSRSGWPGYLDRRSHTAMKHGNLLQQVRPDRYGRSSMRTAIADGELWCFILLGLILLLFAPPVV